MLAYDQKRDRQEAESTSDTVQAAEPDYGLGVANLEERKGETDALPYACAAPGADMDQACNFIRGLTIALPLSIGLWILMIMGIWAIW